MLVQSICLRGAYNEGLVYAVLDKSRRHILQTATTNGSDYAQGTIAGYHKSRGVGDCRVNEAHTWNGSRFVKTKQVTTGMCRGFAGSAWQLPVWKADVR